jgi:hypothetical protein
VLLDLVLINQFRKQADYSHLQHTHTLVSHVCAKRFVPLLCAVPYSVRPPQLTCRLESPGQNTLSGRNIYVSVTQQDEVLS